ncbi:hypothetical protein ACLB2K_054377 [Fragaria x ananassa]
MIIDEATIPRPLGENIGEISTASLAATNSASSVSISVMHTEKEATNEEEKLVNEKEAINEEDEPVNEGPVKEKKNKKRKKDAKRTSMVDRIKNKKRKTTAGKRL